MDACVLSYGSLSLAKQNQSKPGTFFRDAHLYAVSLKSCVCLSRGKVSTRDIALQLWVTLQELQSNGSAAGLSLWELMECVWPVGSLTLQSPAAAVEGWGLQWQFLALAEGCCLPSVIDTQSKSYRQGKWALASRL